MLFALVTLGSLTYGALAQDVTPVVAWSAKVGPVISSLTGVSVAPDGSTVVVGRTLSSPLPDSPDFGNSSIYIGKLGPDGVGPPCVLTIGSSAEDYPRGMALAADGAVLVTGYSQNSTFPFTPGALSNRMSTNPSFLVRADPCGTVRFAAALPDRFQAATVAVSPDGTILVAGTEDPDQGVILRIDADGKRILNRGQWNANPAAMAVDSQGRIHLTGYRGQREVKAVAARLSSDLQRIEFDVTVGNPAFGVGTALAIADDGALWVAGASLLAGEVPVNLRYSEASPAPSISNSVGMIARLKPDGNVEFVRLIHDVTKLSSLGGTYVAGIGLSADGRLWAGLAGALAVPAGLPASDRSLLLGTRLRSFTPAGEPESELTIPGLTGSWQGVSMGSRRRIVVAGISRFFPVTAGSADAGPGAAATLLAFDLASAEAPRIRANWEILSMDSFGFEGTVRRPEKLVHLSTSADGGSLNYVAGFVPDSTTGTPPPDRPPFSYSIDPGAGALPTDLRVNVDETGLATGAVLVALAPGTAGVIGIPIRHRELSGRPSIQLRTPFAAEGPTDEPVSATLRVRIGSAGLATSPAVRFSIVTDTPWLTLGSTEGTTPADITLTANPATVGAGLHVARLTANFEGRVQSFSVAFEVGPTLRVSPLQSIELVVPQGGSFRVRAAATSTVAPLDFTVEAPVNWVKFSHTSGRTPLELVVTGTPPGAAGSIASTNVTIRSRGGNHSIGLFIQVLRPEARQAPSSVGVPAAPGSLHRFYPASGRCELVATPAPPWPMTLGGCTLRLNGRALPLGGLREGIAYNSVGFAYRTTDELIAHLPDDLEPGRFELEFEDREGQKETFAFEVVPLAPRVLLPTAVPFVPEEKFAGEEVTVRLSGLGHLDGPAPWGDVASTDLTSNVPMQVFVGGRAAEIRGVRLSRTEVGIVELRFAVPDLGPDSHSINIRIAGIDYPAGTVLIPQPSERVLSPPE